MGFAGFGMTLAPQSKAPLRGASAGVSEFGFGGIMLGGLFMLAFWMLVIVGVIWLVVAFARGASVGAAHANTSGSAAGQTPLEISKMRYAKGEITKDQYEQIRRDLSG